MKVMTMSKFSSRQKLDKNGQQKLLLSLCHAMASLKNSNEAAELLADLLGSQEQLMLAKRLYIAKLLLERRTYEQIVKELNTSSATVARVNIWLNEYGIGYKKVLKRIEKKKISIPDKPAPKKGIGGNYFDFAAVRRRYHSIDIIIDDIIKSTSEEQRKKLISALKVLNKSESKRNIKI